MLDDETIVESIRKRPSMYVGDSNVYGFVHYLVGGVELLLSAHPSLIRLRYLDKSNHELLAEAALPVELRSDGQWVPFEALAEDPLVGVDGAVLNALSESCEAEIDNGRASHRFTFRSGNRVNATAIERQSDSRTTRISFRPDRSILKCTCLPESVLASYLGRISHFHPSTSFELDYLGHTSAFSSPGGVVDMLRAVCVPYQVLHEPIHVRDTRSDLELEIALVYHTWHESLLYSFVNGGRAVQGGTHVTGFQDGMRDVFADLDIGKPRTSSQDGLLAIMFLKYPEVRWKGCIKLEIENAELRDIVHDIVVDQVGAWLNQHEDVREQIVCREVFQFPPTW